MVVVVFEVGEAGREMVGVIGELGFEMDDSGSGGEESWVEERTTRSGAERDFGRRVEMLESDDLVETGEGFDGVGLLVLALALLFEDEDDNDSDPNPSKVRFTGPLSVASPAQVCPKSNPIPLPVSSFSSSSSSLAEVLVSDASSSSRS